MHVAMRDIVRLTVVVVNTCSLLVLSSGIAALCNGSTVVGGPPPEPTAKYRHTNRQRLPPELNEWLSVHWAHDVPTRCQKQDNQKQQDIKNNIAKKQDIKKNKI